MSLRFRLNLIITLLMMMFMIGVGYVVFNGTKASIQEGVEASTRVTTQLLDTVIISSSQNPSWGYTHEVLALFLNSLGHVRGNNIVLYNIRGELLYKTPPSKYMDDQIPPEWFVKMLTPEEKSISRFIRFGRLEIHPNATGAIREAWGKVKYLFWLALVFFITLNSMVYWVLGRSLQPLKEVLNVINKVEKGDFSARLPIFKLPEFSRIGQSFNTMGESLQLSTAENKRLALIAQQTADAIVIHDVNGNFSFWNRAAEKLFEYKPEEVIGRSANILIPNEMIADAADNFKQLISGQSIDNQITKRINKSGKLLDVSISAAPMIDPNTNEVIGDICSIRDITERKKTEEALRNLEENRQLTHLIQKHIEDERRSLARELHDELGQYVTVIKTFAVGIRNQAEQQKLAKIAENSTVIASAANQIYDGMHNIIRQLRPGSLDNLGIVETLKDLVNNYQKQNPEIAFKFELIGTIAHVSETISINLYRIVQEGLNNALKYAKSTEVVVRLENVSTDEGESIILSINDNGIGMDVSLVDQSKQFGLLGMRERVQALEGSFKIESTGGTNITINIPNV